MCLFKNGNITLINGMCLFVASSRNGGEHLSAELDGKYKRLRRIVGYAWRTKRSDIMSARYLSM